MTHALTIESIPLYYDEALVVLAHDNAGRRFVGLAFGDRHEAQIAYVEVDRVTEREIVRGEIDLLELLTQRQAGLLLLGGPVHREGQIVLCESTESLPREALPAAGMFLPKTGRAHPIGA